MAVTFDGPNKLMILSTGTTAVNVAQDLYTPWMDWLAADTSRARFLPAFSVSGGNPTIGSEYEGTTFFVLNGWRIRPQEADHYLKVTGNIVGEGDAEIIAPTLGGYTVTVTLRFSSLVQGIATGSAALTTEQNDKLMALPDADAITTAIMAAAVEGSITVQQAQRLLLAGMAGKASGAATDTMRFRDMADSKDRIVATVDAYGNRLAVTLDAT